MDADDIMYLKAIMERSDAALIHMLSTETSSERRAMIRREIASRKYDSVGNRVPETKEQSNQFG